MNVVDPLPLPHAQCIEAAGDRGIRCGSAAAATHSGSGALKSQYCCAGRWTDGWSEAVIDSIAEREAAEGDPAG